MTPERILRVISPNFRGTATWTKDASGWHCTKVSSPDLRWMLSASQTEAHATLVTAQAHYRWLDHPTTQPTYKQPKPRQIPFEQRYAYSRHSSFRRRTKHP